MFTYPKLSPYDFGFFRFLGRGLGNLLFPWARAVVYARKNNYRPIWPTWTQIEIGALSQGLKDQRFYSDLFDPTSNYITKYKKLFLLLTHPKYPESSFIKKDQHPNARGIVIFEGMDNYFHDIVHENEFIRNELIGMTRDKHKSGLFYNFNESISVHVRLGDFLIPQNEMSIRNAINTENYNYRLPLSWYLSVIKSIRKDYSWPVYIFSDGSDSQLADLLSLPNATRMNFGSSIADLLALSKAHVLVASGSTFSMWASYLGRMPVIWFSGQLRQRLYYEKAGAEIEMDFDNNLPQGFGNEIRSFQTVLESDR